MKLCKFQRETRLSLGALKQLFTAQPSGVTLIPIRSSSRAAIGSWRSRGHPCPCTSTIAASSLSHRHPASQAVDNAKDRDDLVAMEQQTSTSTVTGEGICQYNPKLDLS
jgi:hypothetical protein